MTKYEQNLRETLMASEDKYTLPERIDAFKRYKNLKKK